MPIGLLLIHQDLTTKSNPLTSSGAAGKAAADTETRKWMLCSSF